MRLLLIYLVILSSSLSLYANSEETAEDEIELTTTFIQGNKELPQTLYIVPWQKIKKSSNKPDNMVLHSLYGDIFEPVTDNDLRGE